MVFARSILIPLLFLFAAIVQGNACYASQIEKVNVNVIDLTEGADILVLQRMSISMQVVSEQIMAGKDTEYIEQSEYVFKTILADIGNRVFTGYNIERIDIKKGPLTVIDIFIRPWQTVTSAVKVNFYLSGIDPLWSGLIEGKIPGLNDRVSRILTGVSLDAVDWAGVLAKNFVRDMIEEKLPSFKANVDIVPGDIVTVDIVLMPVGSSVKDVNYELRSETMPTLVLLDARASLGNYAGTLRGMPLDFLKQNKSEVEAALTEYTQNERIVKNYDLHVDVAVTPKNDTDVIITLDSAKYRFWIEGYVDISRDDDNLSGVAHMGKLISKKDEIFLETTLYINDIKWKFDPGIARTWGSTRLSTLYRLPDDKTILRLEHGFLKRWRIRVEKFSGTNRPEFALRYRIHEFLAVEFVLGKDKENYVRIVGNL